MSKRSNYERMLAGEPYISPDWDLIAMQGVALEKVQRLNAMPLGDMEARKVILQDLLGSIHPHAMVCSPLTVEYGKHIHIGDCYINVDCMFLDGAEIRIGDLSFVAPRVQFLTAGHPLRAADRIVRDPATGAPTGAVCINRPITIGEQCWIGAGAIILAGVTIGDRTMIGAGSVVTKDIPSDVLAAGNPCRVIRSIEP